MANENKSIQYTKEDWIAIKACERLNPVCENHSAVMFNGFRDARINGINFKDVAKYKFKNDDSIKVDPSDYASPKSFSVDKFDWDYVVDEFKKQLDVERVRISYLARLVIVNYRMRLSKETTPETEVKIQTKTIDGVVLLQRVNNHAAELIKAGEIATVLAFIGEKE